MKSGTWGGKQEVELVAQALVQSEKGTGPEEARPGEGGSVAMELRRGRTQAAQQAAGKEPKKGPWDGGCRPGQGRAGRAGPAGQSSQARCG